MLVTKRVTPHSVPAITRRLQAQEPGLAPDGFFHMGRHLQESTSFVRHLAGFASAGFLAGGGLAVGLLCLDWLNLHSLMMADSQPYPVMAVFVLGFGLLLSPVSLATGLALLEREARPPHRARAKADAEPRLP